MADEDFRNMIERGYSMMNVGILYYMPDHHFIVQEFYWQTLDLAPRYNRVRQFLDYWRSNIEAVIKEVRIQETSKLTPGRWRRVDDILRLN